MKHLSSQELLAKTKNLVAEERRVTLLLIEHLEEISRRMLYAELGYASLWEFATQELGLSEGAAQRRIQAMRLVRDVPEAKASLESGKLSLSNAAKVQSFRQAEKKLGRKPDAHALVAQVETLSQRACEKKLFEISPEALPRERERIVSASGECELRIVVSPKLHEKLKRLKGLLAHAMRDPSYEELLERMTDEMLARIEKKKGIRATEEGDQEPGSDAHTPSAAAAAVIREKHSDAPEGSAGKRADLPAGKRVYLPVAYRRPIWARSKGQCEVVVNGRRCSSRYRLEIDHVQPLALGGSNDPINLRLACWHHNQQQARQKLGRST